MQKVRSLTKFASSGTNKATGCKSQAAPPSEPMSIYLQAVMLATQIYTIPAADDRRSRVGDNAIGASLTSLVREKIPLNRKQRLLSEALAWADHPYDPSKRKQTLLYIRREGGTGKSRIVKADNNVSLFSCLRPSKNLSSSASSSQPKLDVIIWNSVIYSVTDLVCRSR